MSGPIVRSGPSPEFSQNWDNVFGKKSKAKPAAAKPTKKAAAKASPKKKAAPKKKAKK